MYVSTTRKCNGCPQQRVIDTTKQWQPYDAFPLSNTTSNSLSPGCTKRATKSSLKTKMKVSICSQSKFLPLTILAHAHTNTADEERVFLISDELEFRIGETDGEPTLIWRDLHGDIDEFYEFIATGTNQPTRAFFETCMYRAMYERRYKRSANATQDADLEEFVWKCVVACSPKLWLSPLMGFFFQARKSRKGSPSEIGEEH